MHAHVWAMCLLGCRYTQWCMHKSVRVHTRSCVLIITPTQYNSVQSRLFFFVVYYHNQNWASIMCCSRLIIHSPWSATPPVSLSLTYSVPTHELAILLLCVATPLAQGVFVRQSFHLPKTLCHIEPLLAHLWKSHVQNRVTNPCHQISTILTPDYQSILHPNS